MRIIPVNGRLLIQRIEKPKSQETPLFAFDTGLTKEGDLEVVLVVGPGHELINRMPKKVIVPGNLIESVTFESQKYLFIEKKFVVAEFEDEC